MEKCDYCNQPATEKTKNGKSCVTHFFMIVNKQR